jgi:hypothetical protein
VEDTISVQELQQAVNRRELAVQAAESQVRHAAERLRRETHMLKLTQKRLRFKKAGKDSRIWLKIS